ncbi:MAG TPA: stage III sporulation protein AF [Bacillota bacterium]
MIEALSAWLRQLLLLLVAAGIVELALPQGSLRRYVDVVLGLVVLVTILSPLLGWLGTDFEATVEQAVAAYEQHLDGRPVSSGDAAAAGQRWSQAEARRVFAERLAAAIRQGIEDELGLNVHDVEVRLEEDAAAHATPVVAAVRVLLERRARAGGRGGPVAGSESGDAGGVEPISPVAPVRVRVTGSDGAAHEEGERVAEPTADRVRAWVAERFGLPGERVEVMAAP